MGIDNCNQLLFKASNIVARELDALLDFMISNQYFKNRNPSLQHKRIDCDVSNIIHLLSYRHSKIFSTALVRDVALFLKQLASDTGYVITAVLDGNIRPHTKRDAFQRRYTSTMNRINSYFCRQSAMRLASKKREDLTKDESKKLDLFNKEAKLLEASSKMQIPFDFKLQLELALEQVCAFSVDRESGGYVSRDILKAEFEADYLMAYRFRNGDSDCIFSTDSEPLQPKANIVQPSSSNIITTNNNTNTTNTNTTNTNTTNTNTNSITDNNV